MSHWGIPGPGGSMGRCAVCGESFAAGVIKDLCGLPSGIQQFSVGFIDGMLYGHDPECMNKLREALGDQPGQPQEAHDRLPDGPLKDCLRKAIDQRRTTDDSSADRP